jgi:hypothetical protein
MVPLSSDRFDHDLIHDAVPLVVDDLHGRLGALKSDQPAALASTTLRHNAITADLAG